MCTVIYLENPGLLCKNRDKDSPVEETIVNEDGILGIKSLNSNYLSLGINRYGVAFVSTAINKPEWMRAVESGDREKAGKILKEELEGLVRPSRFITERFHTMKSARDMSEMIAAESCDWMPYNIVAADSTQAFHLELHKDNKAVHTLSGRYVVTNHFFSIPYGPSVTKDYPSSFYRYELSESKAPHMNTAEDVQAFLYRSDDDEDRSIWRKGVYDTVSGTVIDLHGKSILYSKEKNGRWLQAGL